MNSKQRRGQRVFVHEIVLRPRQGERYFEFDQRIEAAKGWLQWNAKRKNYTSNPKQFDSQVFKFRSGALASVFVLRWS